MLSFYEEKEREREERMEEMEDEIESLNQKVKVHFISFSMCADV